MINAVAAGRSGKDVRSDARVELSPGHGVTIELESKVDALYGRSIRALAGEMLGYYGITDALMRITDSGALPHVLAARIETAVRRFRPEEQRSWLPPARADIAARTPRDRDRRSRLYLPGNDPKLSVNAGLHHPDAVILDLEDSVAPTEKDAARILVRNTLRAVDFHGAERMVRINQFPLGDLDLAMIIPELPQLILLPKCETAAQVRAAADAIARYLPDPGIPIHLMPIIESARGAIAAFEIASASPSVAAIAIGLEDYTADLGVERTLEGRESLWMRGMVVNAARAAGVQAIDTVFSDVNDMEGLFASTREARALGFDGKGCIHPRQIDVVHRAFAPTAAEIDKAKRIALAFDDAQRQGLGVVALGSKMIDPPVVARALRTITAAVRLGLLTNTWMEEARHV